MTTISGDSCSTSLYGGRAGLEAALRGSSPFDLLCNADYDICHMPRLSLKNLLHMHGIRTPHASLEGLSDDELINLFLKHLLSGKCFRSPADHCSLVQTCFVGKNTFIRSILDCVLTSSSTMLLDRVKDILCATGNVKGCMATSSVSVISHVRDAFHSSFDSLNVICDIDHSSEGFVKELCLLHGIELRDSNPRLPSLSPRDRLLSHIFTTSCIMQKNASCIATSAEVDSSRVHISLLQSMLSRRVRRAPLCSIMTFMHIPYDNTMKLSSLKTSAKRHISRVQKGKDVARNNEYNYLYRQGLVSEDVYIPAVSDAWPSLVPPAVKRDRVDDFYETTSSPRLRQLTCAVCGERKSHLLFHERNLKPSDEKIQLLKKSYPGKVPNPFHGHQYLDGFMLYPEGVKQTQQEEPDIQCCSHCFQTIFERESVPNLSMLNDMVLGDVPDALKDLTVVEEAFIARRRAKCCVIHLQAFDENSSTANGPRMSHGPQRAITQRGIKGHFIVFPSYPERLLSVLPPSMDDIVSYICVIFVGPETPTEEWLLEHAKPLLVRREKVREALLWLKDNNPLYEDIEIDMQTIDSYPEQFIPPVNIETQSETTTSEYVSSAHDNNRPSANDVPSQDIFSSVVVTDIEGKDMSSIEMSGKALTHLRNGGKFVQMNHGGMPCNDYVDNDLYPLLYPTLFPYGIGGFNSPKHDSVVSMRIHARHLFNLADDRFQKHYSFLFSVFNTLQRHDLSRSASVKIKKPDFERFVSDMREIPLSAIENVIERSRSNESVIAHTADEKKVLGLMNKVSLASTNIQGSMASKISMRNQIRSMIATLGLPSFFVTINPADCRNPIVKIIAGDNIDIDAMLPHEIPTFFKQSSLIAKNPFVGAKFFDLFMTAFIDKILGRASPDKIGVLGKYKAHYGTVEAQGRGSLHCHMLVWLEDAMNPQEIRDRIVKECDSEFLQRLILFLDDTMQTSVPVIGRDVEAETVPSDNNNPSSVRRPDNTSATGTARNQKDFRNLVENSQRHVHTRSCFKYDPAVCRFGMSDTNHNPHTTVDYNTGEINYRISDGMIASFCPEILEAVRCNMDIKFIGSGTSAKAILYYITDYITKSPLKAHIAYAALRSAKEKLQNIYEIDSDPAKIGRSIVVKCANALISKQELSAQQVAAFLLSINDHYTSERFRLFFWPAFQRHAENNGASLIDSIDHVSQPETQIRDDETFANPIRDEYGSDNEDASVADDEEDPIEEDDCIGISNDSDGNIVSTGNQVMDYSYRGFALKDICLWDFVSRFDKVSKKDNDICVTELPCSVPSTEYTTIRELSGEVNDTRTRGRRSNIRTDLRYPHPQQLTHILRVRDTANWLVPLLIGPKVYRRDRVEEYEKYCRLMLIFFKPWTMIDKLRESTQSWADAFDDFIIGAHPRLKKIMDNLQILHECKDSRDDHFANRKLVLRGIPFRADRTTSTDADCNLDNDMDEEHILRSMEHAELSQSKKYLTMCKESESAVNEMIAAGIYIKPTNDVSHAPSNTAFTSNEIESELNIEHDPSTPIEIQWRKFYDSEKTNWIRDVMRDEVVRTSSSSTTDPNSISISSLSDAPSGLPLAQPISTTLNEIESARQTAATALKLQSEIIEEFTLNQEQENAFRLISSHSLKTRSDDVDPLKMYIGGRGGTGKSRVIDALKTWFTKRNEIYKFRLCAFTGAAARNIDGLTLHSALRFNTTNKPMSNKIRSELDSIWASVQYLFIDEMSMVSCEFLADVSNALSVAKNNTKDFGGISVIFAGDFCQLPPVGGTPLYSKLTSISKLPRSSLNERALKKLCGRLLWLQVNTVIILHRQMRQKGAANERLRFLLGRISMGTASEDDFDLLNQKLLSNNQQTIDDDWLLAPVITRQNSVKDALNRIGVHTFATKNNIKYHNYYSVDTRSGKPIETDDLQNHLHAMHTGQTQQLMGVLPLAIGIPVIITHNYNIQAGIVNGTEGILKKIRYSTDDKGRRIAKSCIVDVGDNNRHPLPTLQPNEAVALQESASFTFRNPFTRASLTINRKQLPITPAFAFTDYKAQGKTLKRAILDLQSCTNLQSTYVMLSRVQSLDGLLILRPFPRSKLAPSRAMDSAHHTLECKRLRFLWTKTMLAGQSTDLDNIYRAENCRLRKELRKVDFEHR